MRGCWNSAAIWFPLVLAFLLGIILYLYVVANSHVKTLDSANRQLKRDLLSAHNDQGTSHYRFNLMKDDLSAAVKAKSMAEKTVSQHQRTIHDLEEQLRSLKEELDTHRNSKKQDDIDLSNLRISLSEIDKELENAKKLYDRCDAAKSKAVKQAHMSAQSKVVQCQTRLVAERREKQWYSDQVDNLNSWMTTKCQCRSLPTTHPFPEQPTQPSNPPSPIVRAIPNLKEVPNQANQVRAPSQARASNQVIPNAANHGQMQSQARVPSNVHRVVNPRRAPSQQTYVHRVVNNAQRP